MHTYFIEPFRGKIGTLRFIFTLILGLHKCTIAHGNIRLTLIYDYFDIFVIIPLLTNIWFLLSGFSGSNFGALLICIWTYIHSYASLSERRYNKSTFVCKQGVLVLILKFIYVFWEGHEILRNLHLTFDWHYIGQK